MRTNAFRLAAFLTPAVFLSGQSGAQAQKKYQIKLNHLNLQLTANTMELAAILLLLLLLAVAFALAAFAWRGMRVAKAANEKLSIETAERRRAEDATQAGKRLLQSVADNSPATIYIKDRAGRYLLVNRRYEELFHVRMEEMVGRTDYDLFSKETADVFRVMDRNVLAEGRALEGEEVAPLDDGPHIFHSVKFPLPNEAGEFYAVCGISTDITERKRGEAALRESQQRTLAIIDTALDGIITMNHNGQIVEFNPAAERIFGHRRGQVIGRNLAETIIPPRLREQHLRGLAQYLETGEGPVLGRRIELPGVRVDGTEFPLELSIARMPGEGPPLFTGFVRDVSERKEAEATRALLAGIVECSDDAIISKTLDGIVTSWNAGAETIFGYSSSEMIGTSINLLIPSDARNEETEILARIQRGDSISHYETVRLQKGGHRIHVSLAISPLKDAAGRIIGVSKTARDIGERKRAEQRLQAQLGRLSLLDHITHAIGQRQDLPSVFRVVLGTLEDSLPIDFGCVCLYDPVAETLTVSSVGSGSEVLAKELALTPDAQFAIDQNGLARCVQGHLVYEPDVSLLEFPFPQRISRAGLRSLVAAPLLSESNVFGVLVAARREPHAFSSGDCEFLRQLSGHVALAAHHAQIYDALRQAYDDLRSTQQAVMEQERLRVMGQMASGIAHDINNALSPVALYTESLLEREPGLSARTREYLETTQRAIGDVSLTVGRMREFYRQREPQLLLMPVDLNGMVRQVLDLTRARWSDMAHQRGIVIQIRPELEPDLPAVAGIESEIREALTNLVFNAVDAMPEGGTLTLRTKSTGDVGSTSVPRRVHVQVEDTGTGMSEEVRRRCLEPFFTTKGERGTGLGLAMVYGMAQRQNAELEIDSTPGTGTTVGLNFSVVAAGAPPLRIGSATGARTGLRILVVDDDPVIVKSLRSILEGDGHVVTTANGGQEGIDIVRAAAERAERFAVVITDLGMPHVDGRKVASAVKMAHRDTPVILLTGWGQRLVADEHVPANVDRVLNKPPRLYQLRSALAELAPDRAPDGAL